MPGIQPAMMKQLAKLAFKAHAIQLPVDWKQPTGNPEQKHYADAFKPSERAVPPDPSKLFIPASVNKYHVDAVKKVSGDYEKYIDGICAAVCQGIDLWRLQAKFKDLKIMAVSAIGAPGCLAGPELKSLILMTAPMSTPQEQKYSKAIASHVSEAWKKWQDNVTVPGLPWYPAFAAFPGPQAPPIPNVPMPLITCPSPMMSEMTPEALKKGMIDKLGETDAQHHAELMDSVAKAIGALFLAWLPQQQVMLVLGKGPIPTFAPPFVPVGPVVAGDNIAAPGHLAA